MLMLERRCPSRTISVTQRALTPVVEQSIELHNSIAELWEELPEITSPRSLAVVGFAAIVQQHVSSQLILAKAGLDVPATTLVRPAYEALIRAVWCLGGAEEEWIEKFLTYRPEIDASGAETEMGPNVQRMLDQIEGKHPADVHRMLSELKQKTWLAMHSYVHGGIRPFVQGLVGFREHEVTGVVMNANAMLVIATNVVRMAVGLPSPMLPALQKQYASCLPPEQAAIGTL